MTSANKIRIYLALIFFGAGLIGIINLLILGGFISVQDLQDLVFIKFFPV